MERFGDLASIPSPPRPIRRRRGYFQIAIHHVFLVCLVMVASVFWQIATGVVRLMWFSTLVPAQVTKVLVTPGKHGPSYDILIAYRFGEADYSETLSIAPLDAETLKEGDTVQVQVLPEWPERGRLYQENYPHVFVTVLLCLFTLGPTLGLAKMLWHLYVSPWRLRSLLRHGAATSAVIVDKKEISARPPNYVVTYEYQVPFEAVVRATMKVPQEDFQAARVGDQVVILYDPERPRRSVVYRYADYAFASFTSAPSMPEAADAGKPSTWQCVLIVVTAAVLLLGIGWVLGWW